MISLNFTEAGMENPREIINLHRICVISSVGSEHYLDRVGVTGSSPV